MFIARLGSTRLSRKHLITVAGKTFVEWLIGRFENEFGNEIANGEVQLIIATSDEEENRLFSELFKNSNVKVFFGSKENIPLRQLQCAGQFGLEKIISVDGDDILCSTSGARKVFDALRGKAIAAKTVGLPLGMNVFGYRSVMLQKSVEGSDDKKLETGWGRIFDDASFEVLQSGTYDKDQRLRFTLDYKEDELFFASIIQHFGLRTLQLGDEELISYVIDNKLYEINQGVNDTYWNNFTLQKEGESN